MFSNYDNFVLYNLDQTMILVLSLYLIILFILFHLSNCFLIYLLIFELNLFVMFGIVTDVVDHVFIRGS